MKRLAPGEHTQLPHPSERVANISVLPEEILQNIASRLDFTSKFSASRVNKFFNQAIYYGEKNARIADFFPFLFIVLNSLDLNLYPEQKKLLSEMIEEMRRAENLPVSLFNELIKIDVKIGGYKQKITGILLGLSSVDLDNVFDSFADRSKSSLFYECVFLSNKYELLSQELSQEMKWKKDPQKIKELLALGALPTFDLLKDAIVNQTSAETLVDLLDTRPDFKNPIHLNCLLEFALCKIRVDLSMVQVLIETGAVPTEIYLKLTFSNLDATKFLIDRGVVPTDRVLNVALHRKQAVEEIITLYLDSGVLPSISSLNNALCFQYSEAVILRMLETLKANGTKPMEYAVYTAFRFMPSDPIIRALLEAGFVVTRDILKEAERIPLAPETLEYLREAFHANNGS